ncbi:amino acid adenylation domain-containing protein [Streptomyces sp. 147326]|uniref:non-ribosomal peptide synthetase n=1 Tax=Streptomyces sp. 147326 TaxID=3074379 RepID=UPI003857BDD5
MQVPSSLSPESGGSHVLAFFARSALAHAHKPAVREDHGRTLTYLELDRAANGLAHELTAHGVGPEDIVGILFPRSADWVVAALAVLKAGGAFLSLNAEDPVDRLLFTIRDAQARVLIGEPDAERLGQLSDQAVVISPRRAVPAAAPPPTVPDPPPGRAAYAIYTSGSTGRPKGVLVEHEAFANQLGWLRAEHPLGPDECVPFKYTVGYDAALWEAFGTLVCGGTLVVADSGAERDAGYLLDLCRRHAVTVLNLTPTHLHALLTHPRFDGLGSVRRIHCGGEELTAATALRCLRTTRAALFNMYGPTETTITATSHRVERDSIGTAVALGRPAAHTQVYVLGPQLEPLPPGSVGEICIGGVQVARGYLGRHRDGAESARFVPDPFRGQGSGRMFRTGDLGRYAPDGTLWYHGRSDDQVQLRGQRVEPREVELSLMEHPDVRECAVTPVERDGRPRALQAHVVCVPGRRPTFAGIRSFLAERLPASMVPARFTVVGELPRNAAGKLDRAALAGAGESVLLPGADEERGPLSPTEAVVVACFRHVLEDDTVSVADDFFHRGGDSVGAVELVTRLGRMLGRTPEVRDVFLAPTPRKLADRLRGAGGPRTGDPLPGGLLPSPGTAESPPSSTQRGFLESRAAHPAHPVHHVRLAVRLTGPFDPAQFAWAAEQVLSRHSALRTAFHRTDDGWLQRVHEGAGSLFSLRSVTTEVQLRSEIAEETEREFDLGRPPLARVTVFRRAPHDHVLVLVAHGAVADAWSLELLLRDLSRYYFHRVQGCMPPAPLRAGYPEYAEWRRSNAFREAVRPQADQWRERLRACPPPADLADLTPPAARSFRTTTVGAVIGRQAAQAVELTAKRCGVTSQSVLLAAFQLTVGVHTQTQDVLTWMPDTGRLGMPGLQTIVGPLAQMLPLRCVWSGEDTFEKVVRAVGARVADARANHLGTAHLWTPEQISVAFDHQGPAVLRPGTVTLTPMRLHAGLAPRPVSMLTSEVNGTVRTQLVADRELVSLTTLHALSEDYTRLVGLLCRETGRQVGTLLPTSGAHPLSAFRK